MADYIPVTGKIIHVEKIWWIKINTKPVRRHMWDGAEFPHWITVRYEVNGETFEKRKYFPWQKPKPKVGDTVRLLCRADQPRRCKLI